MENKQIKGDINFLHIVVTLLVFWILYLQYICASNFEKQDTINLYHHEEIYQLKLRTSSLEYKLDSLKSIK